MPSRDAPCAEHGYEYLLSGADQAGCFARGLSSGFSEEELLPLLSEFETRFEQELIPRLSENHAAGLQMDTITGGGFVALKKQLQLAAGDERIRRNGPESRWIDGLRMCGRYAFRFNKPAVEKLGLQTSDGSILHRNHRWSSRLTPVIMRQPIGAFLWGVRRQSFCH